MNLNPLSLAIVNPRVATALPVTSTGDFLGFPLVANTSTVGTAISEIINQANAEPDLDQAVAGSQPTLGRYPNVPGGLGVRNLFTTATTTFTTRTFTTAAVPYTFSFIGTGTVTLSGTSTAGPLIGTGASNRVSLTFTPTAGTLTLTVSGTCTFGQIEFGSTMTGLQVIGAGAYDVTESGCPSVLCSWFDGGDFLSYGVTQFSATASLFADSAQRWSVGGTFRLAPGAVGNFVLLAKCSSTAANKTFQLFSEQSNSQKISAIIRGFAAGITAASVADGLIHAWLMVWDGTTLNFYIDSTTAISVSVGSAAEEVQNIIVGARTESGPAAFFNGFNNQFLSLARTMSAAEVSQFFSFCRTQLGSV